MDIPYRSLILLAPINLLTGSLNSFHPNCCLISKPSHIFVKCRRGEHIVFWGYLVGNSITLEAVFCLLQHKYHHSFYQAVPLSEG